jgi:hypothetical protein
MKNFKTLLHKLHACSEAKEWAGDMTIEEVVEKCHRGDWLLWLAARVGVEQRLLILAKGHSANTVRHLMKDERSIKAVDAAIAYGEGIIDADQLYAAAFTADAAFAADAAAADAAAFTADAAYSSAAYAAFAAASAAYAADAAAYSSAKKENQLQTADICRKYIGQLIIDKVNQRLNGVES